uniref:Uncharacterized protein n=1 Tax=Candidatus Kentrum sp. LPFa TaxID=2126335 RepID=A0A450X2S7_9GAMM|nr:MAG: hypothetical protein BECKLPF1236A_GA0070988_1000225 [Candidatus Kentron sp. LPFa]VFK23543.1 MAG: hypothetical protein BECKLPF1236C_GA0070990_1000619 [Candidatus Kentron sp. LPFa]
MVDARSDPPYGPDSGLLLHSKDRGTSHHIRIHVDNAAVFHAGTLLSVSEKNHSGHYCTPRVRHRITTVAAACPVFYAASARTRSTCSG